MRTDMNKLMTAQEFIDKLNLAVNSKTVYAKGGWGACAGIGNNRQKYAERTPFNTEDILRSTNDTFFFDCVCLPKGILWGWNADTTDKYGGAKYASNGVGDYSIKSITNMCPTYDTDFSNIVPGEWLHLGEEHCGIYIGNGKAIESTPIWDDGVQKTGVQNVDNYEYNSRRWDGHGRLLWIDYEIDPHKDVLIVDGWWGNNTTYFTQKMLNEYPTGKIYAQANVNKEYLVNINEKSWKFAISCDGSTTITKIQLMLKELGYYNRIVDGLCGKYTITAMQEYLRDNGYYTHKIDGYLGYYTVCAWQNMVNDHFHKL